MCSLPKTGAKWKTEVKVASNFPKTKSTQNEIPKAVTTKEKND